MIRRFARPYARAIMDIAQSPQKAAEVRDELQRFDASLAPSRDLQELYANPGIDFDTKLAVTRKIATRLEISDLGVKVLEVLIRNHRINQLGAMIEGLTTYINEALDITVAEVRTAHRLSDAEATELRSTLERKAGKRVEVRLTVDPTLLGGFVARIGSEIWDASVAGKIHKFRDSLA